METSSKDTMLEQDGASLKDHLLVGKETKLRLAMVKFTTVIGSKEFMFASWMEIITMLFLNE